MESEHSPLDVGAYASAVREELANLPPAEREALLEDLEDHLAEVAAEGGGPLEIRLGTPAAYAAELRSAYGVASRDATSSRIITHSLSRIRAWLEGFSAYRAMKAFMPELRPGWWVLRGYLVAVVLAIVFRNGDDVRPIPNPFSSHGLLELVVAVVAIAISVRIGRRAATRKSWRRSLGWAPNVLLAVAGVAALGSMGTGYSWASSVSPGVSEELGPYSSAVAGSFPGPVTNIYPYGTDGKPLHDVLLYDQNGQPITIGGKGFGVNTQYTIAADGKPVTNEYPLRQTGADGSPVTAPRVAIPPTPSPSPTPSAAPSPAATATP